MGFYLEGTMFLFSHSHPAFVTVGSHLLLLPHPVEALGVWGITSSAMHLDVQAVSSIPSVSSTAALTGGLRERPGGVLPLHLLKASLCLPGVGLLILGEVRTCVHIRGHSNPVFSS